MSSVIRAAYVRGRIVEATAGRTSVSERTRFRPKLCGLVAVPCTKYKAREATTGGIVQCTASCHASKGNSLSGALSFSMRPTTELVTGPWLEPAARVAIQNTLRVYSPFSPIRSVLGSAERRNNMRAGCGRPPFHFSQTLVIPHLSQITSK